jgi:hypothetical protein
MSKVFPNISSDKLAFIRSGKRRKSLTGFKANKKFTLNDQGKFEVIQKEKKFEEAGVTKTKRNYVMFESKLGTEREIDLNKIAGAQKKFGPTGRNEEKIYIKKKKKEYLDNYQYHETKDFGKDPIPTVVIHKRWGDPIGGSFEETTVKKVRSSSANVPKRQGGNKPDLRGKPKQGGETTKTKTTTTKVVKRTVGGQPTYKSTTAKTVTRGGKTSTTTRTTTGRGKK